METAHELLNRLKGIVRRQRRCEAELARTLLEVQARRLYRVFGYARIQDFAEAELDLGRAKVKDLIEIANRVNALPGIAEALDAGELDWTKARQLVRIASRDDETAWLAKARVLTNRGLERAIAEAKGETPRVKRMADLSAGDAADVDEAVRRLCEERGEAIPFGEAIAELARRAMGSPVERPGHQVVIHECPTCGAASRDTRDGDIDVGPAELAAAKVDAEIIDLREGPAPRARKTIAPAERRAVIAREHARCAGCRSRAWLHIHHTQPGCGDPGTLCLLCSACHKQVVHGGHARVVGRAGAWRLERVRAA